MNKINEKYYKRLRAYILYLSKDWKEEDGGELVYYENEEDASNKVNGKKFLPKYLANLFKFA